MQRGDFVVATVRDGCVKTMISERGHKLVSVLEAFWLGTLPVLAGSVWQML